MFIEYVEVPSRRPGDKAPGLMVEATTLMEAFQLGEIVSAVNRCGGAVNNMDANAHRIRVTLDLLKVDC